MKIHLQVIVYNESRMVKPFLDWYQWCTSLTVYNNLSTDDTVDRFLEIRPDAKIVDFNTDGKINNKELTKIKNEGWKSHRDNEWVVVVDLDEFLHNPFDGDIPKYLSIMRTRGISVIPSVGFDMHFPYFYKDFYRNFKKLVLICKQFAMVKKFFSFIFYVYLPLSIVNNSSKCSITNGNVYRLFMVIATMFI